MNHHQFFHHWVGFAQELSLVKGTKGIALKGVAMLD
jgi:hypothetical protein